MAVDGAPPTQAVFEGEEGWAFPVEEALLDGVAVGMLTDAASCRVMAEAYVSFCFSRFPFALLNFALLELDFEFVILALSKRVEREFDFGLWNLLYFVWCVEVWIFDHLLYVVRFRLRRLDYFENGVLAPLGSDNLLCLIGFYF